MLTGVPDWIRNISEVDQLSYVSSHKVQPTVSFKLVVENVSISHLSQHWYLHLYRVQS